MKQLLIVIFFICYFFSAAFSQTVSTGGFAESLLRMNQVLGLNDDISSFTQHPLNSAFNVKGDSAIQNLVAGKNLISGFKVFGIPSSLKLLPFSFLNENNLNLPFGYNNGPMYPNVGYQSMISGGFYLKAGVLNIQIKPEVLHAENASFLTFANVQGNYNTKLVPVFFAKINGIDAPERFGPYGINIADLGQSKITVNYKNIEAGVSTENLWWGPGIQNSIMMSNSAPGFLHWTFNTVNPITTVIGSFEWQIIGGRLTQSGYTPYDPGKLIYAAPNAYIPKPVVNRYLSAFTFNWHPKWVEGFFLGLSGYDYLDINSNWNQKSFISKYLPVFKPSGTTLNSQTTAGSVVGDAQDFAFAINMRQIFKEYKAEVYFEWARNDNAASLRDFILEPEHSTAYTLGSTRYFVIKKDQYIKASFELTHLQIPDNFLVRLEPSWYVHKGAAPLDGYTNQGRYLGAGIGPGSNSLMFDLSYVRKLNSFGIKFERYVHDNDMYFIALGGTTDYASHWVDISSTFYANIKIKKFLISGDYTPIQTYNYEYLQNNDISNRHVRLTLTYLFD